MYSMHVHNFHSHQSLRFRLAAQISSSKFAEQTFICGAVLKPPDAQKKPVLDSQLSACLLRMIIPLTMLIALETTRTMTTVLARSRVDGVSETKEQQTTDGAVVDKGVNQNHSTDRPMGTSVVTWEAAHSSSDYEQDQWYGESTNIQLASASLTGLGPRDQVASFPGHRLACGTRGARLSHNVER